jgi:hypothetical protein
LFSSIGNITALFPIDDRNALTKSRLYGFGVNKLAGIVRIITVTLWNVAVPAHSLNVGAVGTIMTTKLVVPLSIANNER